MLPVLLVAGVVELSALTVPIRPEFIALGLTGGIGIVHTIFFALATLRRILLAAAISLASVIVMSGVNWLMFEAPLIPTTLTEVQVSMTFVTTIFAGYLLGGMCADVLLRWRKSASIP